MLSEIDLKDWIKTEQPSKLFEIPRDSLVSSISNPDKPFWFFHIDGMYSMCKELSGETFHIAAWTDVFKWVKK